MVRKAIVSLCSGAGDGERERFQPLIPPSARGDINCLFVFDGQHQQTPQHSRFSPVTESRRTNLQCKQR